MPKEHSSSIEDKDKNSLQVDVPQRTSFDQSSYEARMSKLDSDIGIFGRMLFDKNPKFDLSFTHRNSQFDLSCDSESTDDSNLDN